MATSQILPSSPHCDLMSHRQLQCGVWAVMGLCTHVSSWMCVSSVDIACFIPRWHFFSNMSYFLLFFYWRIIGHAGPVLSQNDYLIIIWVSIRPLGKRKCSFFVFMLSLSFLACSPSHLLSSCPRFQTGFLTHHRVISTSHQVKLLAVNWNMAANVLMT